MEDDKAGPRPPRPDVSIERAADRTHPDGEEWIHRGGRKMDAK